MRLEIVYLALIERRQIRHAVGSRTLSELLQLRDFAFLRNDNFAAALMGNSLLHAVGIQEVATANAQARFRAARRVVDS